MASGCSCSVGARFEALGSDAENVNDDDDDVDGEIAAEVDGPNFHFSQRKGQLVGQAAGEASDRGYESSADMDDVLAAFYSSPEGQLETLRFCLFFYNFLSSDLCVRPHRLMNILKERLLLRFNVFEKRFEQSRIFIDQSAFLDGCGMRH